MQLFRDVVDECGFHDLGFVGSQYTWKKHFADGHSIWERLDRGLANNEWLMKFPGTKVHILSSDTSDHSLLWVVPDGLEQPCMVKPFRFEEMWLADPGCANIIEAVWSPRSIEDPSVEVMRKIERLGKELSSWNRVHFGNVRTELQKKRNLLKEAEDQAMQIGVNFRICALKQEIRDLMDKENWLWFQRAKALWASNETKIQSFSTAVQHNGSGKILSSKSKTQTDNGGQILKMWTGV